MESFEFNHFYYRFPHEVINRFDVLFNDTVFDVLHNHENRAKFPFKYLKDVVDFRKEKKNPQLTPLEDFMYTDIGSIDTLFGEPLPSIMQGKDASSSRMRQLMRSGDVLLSTTRPFRNAIFVVPENLDNQICSTGFSVLIPKAIDSKFLFYALRSEIGNLQLQRFCSGSGYPAINQEIDVPELRIPCPDSLIDQKRIVAAIDPIERRAKVLKEQATKLQNQAVNFLLEQLQIEVPTEPSYFFKTGKEETVYFSVPADADLSRLHCLYFHPKQNVLQDLKRNYKTVSLADICIKDIRPGVQPLFVEGGQKLALKTVDMKNRYIDYENALTVTDEFFDSNALAHVSMGDIIIAATGYVSMGKVDVFEKDFQALISGELLTFTVNENYDPYFIAYYLRSHLGQVQIEKYWTGSSGQIHLYAKDVRNFVVPSYEDIPKKRQEEISKVIREKIERAIELENEAMDQLTKAKEIFLEFVLN